MSRLLLALLLICLCAATSAREVRKLSASDEGGCPDSVAVDTDTKSPDAAADAPQPSAKPASPAKRAATSLGDSDQSVGSRLQTPRWHSFLPGMFR